MSLIFTSWRALARRGGICRAILLAGMLAGCGQGVASSMLFGTCSQQGATVCAGDEILICQAGDWGGKWLYQDINGLWQWSQANGPTCTCSTNCL